MISRALITTPLLTILATPVIAHTGDHSALKQDGFLQHITQSPLHIVSLSLLATALALVVIALRKNDTNRRKRRTPQS